MENVLYFLTEQLLPHQRPEFTNKCKMQASHMDIDYSLIYHRYSRPRLLTYTYRMWGSHVKSKMAEQGHKRLIDCITKTRF